MADRFTRNDGHGRRDVKKDDPPEKREGLVCGRNAVRELIRSGRDIDKIFVLAGHREGSAVAIVAEAKKLGITVIEVPAAKLDAMCAGVNHQGICAVAAGVEYASLDDVFALAESRGEPPFIVICDGIEDPHNLGAIIRICECAGVHGIVIPARRSIGVTPVVAKTSAGAVEHVPVVKVTNLAQTVDKLKERGVWIFACEVGGDDYFNVDFSGGCAIILGSEGDGVSRLLLDKSDFRVSIPMWGKVNSLNVSTAAAVVVCHAARAHHGM